METAETHHALDMVAQLQTTNASCLEVLRKARATENHPSLLRAVDRVLSQPDFSARLTGDMQDAIGAGSLRADQSMLRQAGDLRVHGRGTSV